MGSKGTRATGIKCLSALDIVRITPAQLPRRIEHLARDNLRHDSLDKTRGTGRPYPVRMHENFD